MAIFSALHILFHISSTLDLHLLVLLSQSVEMLLLYMYSWMSASVRLMNFHKFNSIQVTLLNAEYN